MTNPYPPYQAPKRLERSRDNKVFGGVCAGIANYLNMDPTLVRLLVVAITVLTGGAPIPVYLLGLFLPQEAPRTGGQINPSTGPGWGQEYPSATGYPQQTPAPGSYAPRRPEPDPDPVWGPAGAPWQQPYSGSSGPGSPAAGDDRYPDRPTDPPRG